jgi:multiple sugar transport system substrate-binding protein
MEVRPGLKLSKGLFSIVLIAILVSVACICITGCSSNEKADNGVNKPVTISVWHPWGGPQKELLTAVIAEFDRTHPGIRVEPLYTPNDLGSNQKFFTAVAAQRPPDVIFVDGPQTAAWAEQGAIQPLDPWIRKAGIKESDYFVPSWKQNAYKGHVWALPYCADPNFAFAWNKKVFREVGLDPERPPRTLKELDEYNDRITKVENGKMVRIGFIPWGQGGAANSIFSWGWAFKGNFYDPDKNKITANDPNNVRALQWMLSYLKKYDIRKINAFTSGFGSREQNPLYTGQMAMSFLHISQIEDINTYAPNLDYGLSFIPTPEGGEEHSSWVGGWCVGLPKGCKHPKEAWEFIRWCTRDPKGTAFVASKQGLMPGYRYSPYFKTIENKPGYGVFLKILRECKHQRPVMPAQSFYMTELEKVMDYTLYGKMTPKQALDMATKETQTELDLRLSGR